MKRIFYILPFAFLILFSFGCQKEVGTNGEEISPSQYYTADQWRTINAKLNLPTTPYAYNSNGVNGSGNFSHVGTLGRVLFYDEKLSIDGTVSCASCHDQKLAFSDDKDFSDGPNGRVTDRNSIALGTFKSFGGHYGSTSGPDLPRLFWDERAETVEEQLKQTITNPDEMGMDLYQLERVLKREDYYQTLFQRAFGSQEITHELAITALARFVNSLETKNSKLDQNLNGRFNWDFAGFSEKENLGKRVFNEHCNSCHGISLTSGKFPSVAHNGIQLDIDDKGVGGHTGSLADLGLFKVPSLRNIELTAPYMHDGRFATLEEVVEHYNSGIQDHPNLSENLKERGAPVKMELSETEKENLIVFLQTLTDETLTAAVRWSDPFR